MTVSSETLRKALENNKALQPIDLSDDPPIMERVHRLIDRRTVCDLLDISGDALRRWVMAGKFPAPVFIGGLQRWRAADYNKWLEDQLHPPPPPKRGARR